MQGNLRNYFSDTIKSIIGFKIGNTRVMPVATKIIIIFIIVMLLSNLSSNYINLLLNRNAIIKLAQQILIKDLTDLYNLSTTHYDLFQANIETLRTDDEEINRENEKIYKDRAFRNIEVSSMDNITSSTAIALGVLEDGNIEIKGSREDIPNIFRDTESLNKMKEAEQGIILFEYNDLEYLGTYKYEKRWKLYMIRAEELDVFYKDSNRIFSMVSIIIFIVTAISTMVGIFTLNYVLRYIKIFTKAFVEMNKEQTISRLDIANAPNDDITFLGTTFNIFSDTISNLIDIFKKFVSQDVAYKAYKEKEVKLEGSQQDLTMLFSDIRRFTFITEMLGNDIIKLLNVHYESAIDQIVKNDGAIGSIIGDALLAVYGTMESTNNVKENKSILAIKSAYGIQKATLKLRKDMEERKNILLRTKGTLAEEEENTFRAVSIEVGVGIDGGWVFYGNVGSYEHMTNTVIGDNVNNASRLESLTKLYQIPVICSEYIKNDVEKSESTTQYTFLEIDTVQVIGKTQGKKIYWPIPNGSLKKIKKDIENYEKGLNFYYNGDWDKSRIAFRNSNLPPVLVFLDRIKNESAPKEWSGIWVMKEK